MGRVRWIRRNGSNDGLEIAVFLDRTLFRDRRELRGFLSRVGCVGRFCAKITQCRSPVDVVWLCPVAMERQIEDSNVSFYMHMEPFNADVSRRPSGLCFASRKAAVRCSFETLLAIIARNKIARFKTLENFYFYCILIWALIIQTDTNTYIQRWKSWILLLNIITKLI